MSVVVLNVICGTPTWQSELAAALALGADVRLINWNGSPEQLEQCRAPLRKFGYVAEVDFNKGKIIYKKLPEQVAQVLYSTHSRPAPQGQVHALQQFASPSERPRPDDRQAWGEYENPILPTQEAARTKFMGGATTTSETTTTDAQLCHHPDPL